MVGLRDEVLIIDLYSFLEKNGVESQQKCFGNSRTRGESPFVCLPRQKN